ncbi:MAG: hypothetical protein IJD92_02970 [Bacilli bacterium]|nr:hypothetical protein [Bacilli bacterium]
MIENGTIVELSNNKKYILTDSVIENNHIYYLALEVDYKTEIPNENSMFFELKNNNILTPITDINDIDFLKIVFVNKFIENTN